MQAQVSEPEWTSFQFEEAIVEDAAPVDRRQPHGVGNMVENGRIAPRIRVFGHALDRRVGSHRSRRSKRHKISRAVRGGEPRGSLSNY